jgi:Kdo2-lipid IVA lauroyltransferase/acyltransferase
MFDRLLSRLAAWLVSWLRRGDPDRASDRWGAFARRIGPFLPANRIGRDNLRAAFPEKDPAWIEATLGETWENLGRVIGEYVHLGRIWDYDPDHPDAGRIETDAAPLLVAVRDDGLPALCFAAHLGNWELPAVAVHQHGVPSAVVYRMPNNRAIAGEIVKIRGGLMGRLIRTRAEAAFEMAGALDAGLHLGMLVDQHFSRGVDVTFFGRTCKANPTIARLARQYDCPVVGVRVIRLPGHRFRISAIGPITLPRDAQGRVDVQPATQMMTDIIESWIREHPGQWLWFHRRWR